MSGLIIRNNDELGQSIINLFAEKMDVRYREVLFKANVRSRPRNGIRYREVSAIKCPLYRGSLKGKLIGINPFS